MEAQENGKDMEEEELTDDDNSQLLGAEGAVGDYILVQWIPQERERLRNNEQISTNAQDHDRSEAHGMKLKWQGEHIVAAPSSVGFSLKGFWDSFSEKLCMVGSGFGKFSHNHVVSLGIENLEQKVGVHGVTPILTLAGKVVEDHILLDGTHQVQNQLKTYGEIEVKVINMEFKSRITLKEMLIRNILIRRYFVLTARDVEEWYKNPESFYHERDSILWLEGLSPSAVALYRVLFENNSQLLGLSLFLIILKYFVAALGYQLSICYNLLMPLLQNVINVNSLDELLEDSMLLGEATTYGINAVHGNHNGRIGDVPLKL